MSGTWTLVESWVRALEVGAGLRALALVVLGLLLGRFVARLVQPLVSEHLGGHRAMLIRRGLRWGIGALFAVAALHELGFQLGVILGAAGVLSVALGFAAQTSASNLVSGLFLLLEHPFQVGDVIRVAGTTGEIISIDPLSVKLRTFDNLFVRIPNETLIKSEVTNLTRFPIRRIDLLLSVAYKEDLTKVRELLLGIAELHPLSLAEPAPLVIMTGFGQSGIDLQFSCWAARPNFLELRNDLYERIRSRFAQAGVEIPFPHQSLYAGSQTEPFPVRLVDSPASEGERG